MINIYKKGTREVLFKSDNVRFSGAFMGDDFIEVDVLSSYKIDFNIGDFVEYNNSTYKLRHIPDVVKNHDSGVGEAYNYGKVRFDSIKYELSDVQFYDFVADDNKEHHSGLPYVRFYAPSAKYLAERLQINLDRVYSGDKKWTVTIVKDYIGDGKQIELDKASCLEALNLIPDVFGLNYIIKDRNILIGTEGITVDNVFENKLGKGLFNIKITPRDKNAVKTRLKAFGSDKNIPYRWYNKQINPDTNKPYIPESMFVPRLTLPDFLENGGHAHIDSSNIDELGVREVTLYFDGTDDGLIDIHPTIKNMTKSNLENAGVNVDLKSGDNGNLDEVDSLGTMPKDNGILPEEGSGDELEPGFILYIKDIGFDLSENIAENPRISMTSGPCMGMEFDIVSCKKDTKLGYTRYKLDLNRYVDDRIGIAFPNSEIKPSPGDKFVILGIELHDVYVFSAMEQLKKEATKLLEEKLSRIEYNIEPSIDNLFIKRNPNLESEIIPGNILSIKDKELNIDERIIIDSVSMSYVNGVKDYKLVLANEKGHSFIDDIIDQIEAQHGQGGGVGMNPSDVISIVKNTGRREFLSKTKKDVALGLISFKRGIEIGDFIESIEKGIGGVVTADGYAQLESLDVRKDIRTVNDVHAKNVKSLNVESTTGVIDRVKSKQIESNFGSIDSFNTLNLIVKTLAKIHNLTVENTATLLKATIKEYISSDVFVSGFAGEGFLLEKAVNGDWNLELDNLTVRKVFDVFEIVVQRIEHQGGMVIRTPSGGNITKVTDVGSGWKCEHDGLDDFVFNDQVLCQNFKVESGAKVKRYWRLATEAGKGFVVLSKTDCEANSSIPEVGDSIVQLGNRTNTKRQSAQIINVIGDDAPHTSFYEKINNYSLNNKLITRTGNLTGIVDEEFGRLEGSGLYAVNAYLKGIFRLSNGKTVEESISDVEKGIDNTVNKAIDEIDVNSRNLIPKSEYSKDIYIGDYTWNMESDNRDSGFIARYIDNINIKKGDVYCISFEIKGTMSQANTNEYSIRISDKSMATVAYLREDISEQIYKDEYKELVFMYEATSDYDFMWGFQLYNHSWRKLENSDEFIYHSSLTIRNFKVSKSSKFTGWSQAPEDAEQSIKELDNTIQKEITEVRTDFEIREGEISGKLTESIKVLNESKALSGETIKTLESTTEKLNEFKITADRFDGTLSEITKKQGEIDSSILAVDATAKGLKLTVDGFKETEKNINQSVAKLEATHEGIVLEASEKSAQKAIDDLEIGTENLILNSSKLNKGGYGKGYTNIKAHDDGSVSFDYDGSGGITFGWINNLISWGHIKEVEDQFKEGEDCIFSCWISSPNQTTPPMLYLKSTMGYKDAIGSITELPSRVYIKYKWSKNSHIAVNLNFKNLKGSYRIHKFKIEKGNKPTDWSANSKDFASIEALTETNTKLEVNAKAIQAEANRINTLTGRVQNAEAELNPDKIWLKVKDNTTKLVDDIDVGGSNILSNSRYGSFLESRAWVIPAYNELTVKNGIAYYKTISGSGASRLEREIYLDSGVYTISIRTKGVDTFVFEKFTNSEIINKGKKIEDDWYVIYATFKVLKRDYTKIRAYYGSVDIGTDILVHWFKLEKGNKPTDWTENNNDIALNSDLKETQSKLEVESNKILAQSQSINKLTGELNETKAELTPDRIWAKVSSKTEKAIDEIQVGGYNILRNSKTIMYVGNASGITRANKDGYFGYKVDKENNNWASFLFDYEHSLIEPDTEYVFSVDIFYVGDNSLPPTFYSTTTGYRRLKGTLVNNEWVRVYLVFKPNKSSYLNPHFGFNAIWGEFYFRNLKVSKGNHYTEWSPSFDEYSTTKEIYSSFEMTDNRISLIGKHIDMTSKVTFSSLDANSQGKINRAKIDAYYALDGVRELNEGLGDLAWEDTVEKAKLGKTIIEGGFIKTELIQANSITADKIDIRTLEAVTINTGRINVLKGARIANWVVDSDRLYYHATQDYYNDIIGGTTYTGIDGFSVDLNSKSASVNSKIFIGGANSSSSYTTQISPVGVYTQIALQAVNLGDFGGVEALGNVLNAGMSASIRKTGRGVPVGVAGFAYPNSSVDKDRFYGGFFQNLLTIGVSEMRCGVALNISRNYNLTYTCNIEECLIFNHRSNADIILPRNPRNGQLIMVMNVDVSNCIVKCYAPQSLISKGRLEHNSKGSKCHIMIYDITRNLWTLNWFND